MSKSHLEIDLKVRPKKSEVERLVCDNRKIKKLINYEPKINFDTGLLKFSGLIKKKIENFISLIFTISSNLHDKKEKSVHWDQERIWHAMLLLKI